MRSYQFTVALHPEFGELGFLPKWMPNADPLSGMALAHDMLEHFAGDDGSLEAELQALGASMFIRGEGGYYASKGLVHTDPAEHVASDFPMLWGEHVRQRGAYLRSCARPGRGKPIAEARRAVARGVKLLRAEGFEELPGPDVRANMARWVAVGYSRAVRRYRGVDVYSLAELFLSIEKEADRQLKHADEGMVCTVRLNVRRCDFSLSCDYPPEESY